MSDKDDKTTNLERVGGGFLVQVDGAGSQEDGCEVLALLLGAEDAETIEQVHWSGWKCKSIAKLK